MTISNNKLNLNTGIQLRGATASVLASVNPVPAAREIMIETDTNKIKIGDGSTAWNSLSYAYPANNGSETWTFELLDGTIVTRGVSAWTLEA